MDDEFSAARVAMQLVEHLERRRADLVGDGARVRAEAEAALAPIAAAYAEAELPRAYWDGLRDELLATLPDAWRRRALAYSDAERRDFGIWRGGDPVARIVYVFAGLLLGGLCVAAPFIPIWEKWFPFALALAAWWLPTAQRAFHERRYAQALGRLVADAGKLQPALEGRVRTEDLLLPDKESTRGQ